MSDIATLLDDAALCLLGADDPTSDELYRLEVQFRLLAELLDDEGHTVGASASSRLAILLGTDEKTDLEIVSQTIAAIQAVLRNECSWEQATLPAMLLDKDASKPKAGSSEGNRPSEEANPVAGEPINATDVDGRESSEATSPKPLPNEFADSASNVDPELLEGFVAEAQEHLETCDVQLLALESEPRNEESLSSVFRAFHTIKGVAGFLELETINRVAHEAENLLVMAREGELLLSGTAIDAVFSATDMLKQLVANLASGEAPTVGSGMQESVNLLVKTLNRVATQTPETGEREAAPVQELPPAPISRQSSSQSETLRVDRSRLDSLVDMIGELVIAESMVQQDLQATGLDRVHVGRNLAQLNKITRNLQELSLSLRMVPIRATFQKMARMVRDLSKKMGKSIEFHMSGEDTELDKTVVDQIGDPLMHMVRNALDHGIEASEQERIDAGKPSRGNVTLRAYHQGGNIYIEIQDDGRGLDPKRIQQKARDRGIIAADATLSDRESLQLIFHPGFSTAEKVTDVSGRGVGMDVVRRNIEALRGNVELRSEPGKGTCVSMRLPLTLAIIDGMVVSVGESRYIIPTLSIVELLRPQAKDVSTVSGRGEYFTVRDCQLPLMRVGRLFRDTTAVSDPANGIVVVVEDDRKKAGLLVDAVHGQQQAVIKSLGHRMEGQRGLAGGAVMPDGKVGLILDVNGLLGLADEPTETVATRVNDAEFDSDLAPSE